MLPAPAGILVLIDTGLMSVRRPAALREAATSVDPVGGSGRAAGADLQPVELRVGTGRKRPNCSAVDVVNVNAVVECRLDLPADGAARRPRILASFPVMQVEQGQRSAFPANNQRQVLADWRGVWKAGAVALARPRGARAEEPSGAGVGPQRADSPARHHHGAGCGRRSPPRTLGHLDLESYKSRRPSANSEILEPVMSVRG